MRKVARTGGQKRSLDEAQARYDLWQQGERYQELTPLRRVRAQITPDRFVHLSQFLRDPAWEATNNGAERDGRGFRHRQGPHFNLHNVASIERRAESTRVSPERNRRHHATARGPVSSRAAAGWTY